MQNVEGGIFDFGISGKSFVKENCHNSSNSDGIDMKLEPVTKPDKKNKTMLKRFDDDAISANCEVIVIFPIYGKFGAI